MFVCVTLVLDHIINSSSLNNRADYSKETKLQLIYKYIERVITDRSYLIDNRTNAVVVKRL